MEKPNKTELATLLEIEAAAQVTWESAFDNQRLAQAAYYFGHESGVPPAPGTKEAWEAATKAESGAHAVWQEAWQASWQASKKAELSVA